MSLVSVWEEERDRIYQQHLILEARLGRIITLIKHTCADCGDGDALKFGESCFLWKAYCKSHSVLLNSRDIQPSQTKVLLALFYMEPLHEW